MNEALLMALSWSAVFLLNVFITAASGFADLAQEGAGIARILFYAFAIVCGGLLITKSFTLTRRLRASFDEDG
jgi:uncharacterized membrane protein YtjA (UPF0391 family)